MFLDFHSHDLAQNLTLSKFVGGRSLPTVSERLILCFCALYRSDSSYRECLNINQKSAYPTQEPWHDFK